MYYITFPQPPRYHQMTLDELINSTIYGEECTTSWCIPNKTNTLTYQVDEVSEHCKKAYKMKVCDKEIATMINILSEFNKEAEPLRTHRRETLYTTFRIPKKNGKTRRIDKPSPELMAALRRLKHILEDDFHTLCHTSAYAYIKKRRATMAAQKHNRNGSKWYLKMDLSDFFGSTTYDFVMQQLSMIYPYSEIMKDENGKHELEKAMELAFLNNGLPQGTPFSPTIINIMMVPIDYTLSRIFTSKDAERNFVYTRYADDIQVSSRCYFDKRKIEKTIEDVFLKFNAPFMLNRDKTKYMSNHGSSPNWILGVQINQDNEISIGNKNRKQFAATVTSFILDYKNGNKWEIEEVQRMEGKRSYYESVEKEKIQNIISKLENKYNVSYREIVKKYLNKPR